MNDTEGRAASPEALFEGWRARGALEPLGGLYTRIARWPTFRWQIGRIVHSEVAEEELRAMWQLIQYNDRLRTLPATIRYVDER